MMVTSSIAAIRNRRDNRLLRAAYDCITRRYERRAANDCTSERVKPLARQSSQVFSDGLATLLARGVFEHHESARYLSACRCLPSE